MAEDDVRRAAGEGQPEAGGEPFAPEYYALERELTFFLRRARSESAEMAREVHPELEPAAYGLLVRLEASGSQRATALAWYFGVGKGTISRQLAALERLGLVRRRPDPLDGRAALLELTEEGGARVARVRRVRRSEYARRLGSWERGEIAELARLLHRLNAEGEDAG
ncbi:MarR family transcriptional regulator [Streptomyces xiaopingdaonensis]|uniref:MarR family winged helix-turn-helix transcriptional regulator n=1 Tax=Streptomyces xiaopingdaonensis TaxID=1565415 RepID=UPI00030486E7